VDSAALADSSASVESASLASMLDSMASSGVVELAVASLRSESLTGARHVDLDAEGCCLLGAILAILVKGSRWGSHAVGAPQPLDEVGVTRQLQSFAESGAVAASVDALVAMVATREAQLTEEADSSVALERADPIQYPCRLLSTLCLVDLPACRKALMAGSTATPTAPVLVRVFEVATQPPYGDGAKAAANALIAFTRCGPEFEDALLQVDSIDEFTSRTIRRARVTP
jgi:hypothetical protein